MPSAPIPQDEQQRLSALADLDILYTPLEERFDRITRTLHTVFNVPITYLSLIDADQQWLKSAQGIDCTTFEREVSVCAYTLLEPEYLVCEDLSLDMRFADNPFVTGEAGLRFYAGFALKSRGQNIGTLCLVDTRPRQFDAASLATFRDLANWAQTELYLTQLSDSQIRLVSQLNDAEKKAQTDSLTHLWNHKAVQDILKRAFQRHQINQRNLSVLMLDLDHFKHINDTYGHAVGDEVLKITADNLRHSLRPDDAIGRYGGEEFMIILEDCPIIQAKELAERLLHNIAQLNFDHATPGLNVTASIGVASTENEQASSVECLMKEADCALYRAKDLGRNQVNMCQPNGCSV